MASSQKPKAIIIDEDVDDLDDLIGQFTPQPVKTPKTAQDRTQSPFPSAKPPTVQDQPPQPALSSTSSASKPSGAPTDAFSEEFAKEFAKGMESLLKELGQEGVPDATGGLMEEDQEREKAFKSAWESMFTENGARANADASSSSTPAEDDSFQSRIKMAMDKLKESESTLKADAGSGTEMESLLSELGKLGDNDEDLQGVLESMMSQLMSKEVLHEPLKELHDKFPSYLADNASKLSEEDKQRYQSQQICITKIIAVFENPKYSEDDPEIGLQVVSLMNEMQAYGAPPTEIMGDLPPGLNLGPDGLPQLSEGCNIM